MNKTKLSLIIAVVTLLFVSAVVYYFLVFKNKKISEDVSNLELPNIIMVDEKGTTTFNKKSLDESLQLVGKSDLSDVEKAGLLYMLEEEKLAYDAYTVLFQRFSQVTFDNIAKSEQNHTEAVRNLVERYGLPDPSLNKVLGEFENADLKKLYVELLNKGTKTIKDSLEVGAAIEEIDILDLQKRISQTDNQDIILVYENLMKGSRNHLRAFTKNFKNLTGQDYVPQYLPQSDYDSIVGAEIERGGEGMGKNRK
ncbi:MAG: DUF2202 domain-containing protein [Patescibacteria group bacterium]|nr:DUF2202 domain-containing protein [Patescibacteria group bacterium]